MNILRFIDSSDAMQPNPVRVGQEGFELASAAAAGLSIVPTLVIGTGIFRSYRNLGQIKDSVVSGMMSFAEESRATQLTIRPTTAENLIGLPGGEKTEIDPGHMRYLVERIYRSWSSSRTKAYRENRHVPDEQSSPAVIVQAAISPQALSIATRNPRTGLRTGAEDYKYNVSNRLDQFKSEYLALMDEVEQVRRRPTLINFEEDDSRLYIAGLSAQRISTLALIEFIKIQYAAAMLDDIEVLSMLEPGRLSRTGRISYDVTSKNSWTVRGIAAYSGAASGILVWPGTPESIAKSEAGIFVAREYSPDDSNILRHCVGAFSSRGGKTSHLAAVANGFRIPAVTGADELEIDTRSRVITLRGNRFDGNSAFVDGGSGIVSLGARPNLRAKTEIKSIAPMPFISWIDDLAQSIVDRGEFGNLTVAMQTHIAVLRRCVAKIQAGHD